MNNRKAKSYSNRLFNEVLENEFLFLASPAEKLMCIVCESSLSYRRRHDPSRNHMKHQVDRRTKIIVTELQKEYVVKRKEDVKKRQNLFVKRSSEFGNPQNILHALLKSIVLSMMVKILLNPVTINKQNVLVIKVVTEG